MYKVSDSMRNYKSENVRLKVCREAPFYEYRKLKSHKIVINEIILLKSEKMWLKISLSEMAKMLINRGFQKRG